MEEVSFFPSAGRTTASGELTRVAVSQDTVAHVVLDEYSKGDDRLSRDVPASPYTTRHEIVLYPPLPSTPVSPFFPQYPIVPRPVHLGTSVSTPFTIDAKHHVHNFVN